MKYSRFFWRSFPGKFGEICAKFLRTLKNLPAPTPMAEEALSGSTDVGLFVRRHGTVFQGYLTSSL